MISVTEALSHLFALARPLASERVPLAEAHGRVLAQPVQALRDHPPFSAAAMDGYALHAEDLAAATADNLGLSEGDIQDAIDSGDAQKLLEGAKRALGMGEKAAVEAEEDSEDDEGVSEA